MAFEAVGHLRPLLLQSEQALNIIRSDTTNSACVGILGEFDSI